MYSVHSCKFSMPVSRIAVAKVSYVEFYHMECEKVYLCSTCTSLYNASPGEQVKIIGLQPQLNVNAEAPCPNIGTPT